MGNPMAGQWVEALTVLVNNAALLVTLGVLYNFLEIRALRRLSSQHVACGLLLGLIAIAVMGTSWQFAPGIIFDTRSVVLSLAGLFFGWVPASIAALMAAAFRLFLGGPGALTGAAVILTSAGIGVLWRRIFPKEAADRSPLELYLFGLVVHLNMLLWMFSLPWSTAIAVLRAITVPVLVLYPLATMFFGWLVALGEERRRTHAALAEREARYRQLVERVPIGLYRSTPDGQLLEANPALAEMLGYPDVESLLRVNARELYARPEDRVRWQQAIEEKGVLIRHEQQLRRADGRVIWARDTARAVRDQDGQVLYYEGALEDITELKEAKAARERLLADAARRAAYLETLNRVMMEATTATREAEFLQRVVEHLAGVLPVDCIALCAGPWAVTKDVAPHLVETCRQFARHSTDLPRGPLVVDWHHPPERFKEMAAVMRAAGVVSAVLTRVPSKRFGSGILLVGRHCQENWEEDTLTLLEAAGQHIGIALERLSMMREAQERAEQATLLASLALRLSAPRKPPEVIEAIGQGALQLTPADRVAVYVREGDTFRCAWRHNLSAWYVQSVLENLDRLPGRSFLTRTETLFVPDTAALPEDSLLRHLAQREGFRSLAVWPLIYEGRTVAALGCYYDEPHVWTPLEQEMMAIFAQQAAVSLRNAQLLEELERTNAALREALKARDEMLRNVTHELRTPLTLIRGYAELLKDGMLQEPQDILEGAQSIYRNALHLEHLINQLLAFQRLRREFALRDTLDVREWLQEVVASWRPAMAEAGIELRLEVNGDLGTVRGHHEFLNQVLYNLLDNARKFSPRGGTVTVRAWVENEELHIQVADEGIGIPPDKLDRIFERFYQVDGSTTRRFGGMGLGLALAKEIVTAHGGRIWAESEGENKGTRITFTLPRVESKVSLGG